MGVSYSYKDRLEGGYQLVRIRRMKTWTAVLLILATSGLSAFSLAARGASAKPLYMPVDAFLPALLVMLFIGFILLMFFRTLEIRYAKKDSQRYLMIQNSMNRAKVVVVLFAIVGAALLFPLTRTGANSVLTGPPVTSTIVANGERVLVLDNMDSLAVTRYTEIVVTLTQGNQLRVLVQDSVQGSSTIPINQVNRPVTISIRTNALLTYTFTFSNPTASQIAYSYEMRRVVVPELFSLVPVFLVGFAASSVAFFLYLRPQREKYYRASIYSAGYQSRVDSGERLYTEYQQPTPVPDRRIPPAAVTMPPVAAPMPVPVVLPSAPPAPPPPPEPAPPTIDELFAEGAALFSGGAYAAAIERFDGVLTRDPRATRALLARGDALLRLGRNAEALDSYDRVLAHERGNLDALRGTAAVYAATHRWRDVIDLADTFLAIVPGDPEMLTFRGDAQLALGKRADAQISYEAALLRKPDDPVLLERIQRAKVDIAAIQSKALIASASGNLDEAVSLFDKVLRIEPENGNALVGKSVALRRAGHVEEALQCLNAVLARQPGHGGALLNKGRMLEERGDLEDALEAYDKLIEISPRDPDAWVAQGDVLAKMGREGDAGKSYREALKIAPSDEDTQGKLRSLEEARAQEGELLRELFHVKGIGPAKARALKDAGFHTVEDFRRATEDQLAQVRGITRKIAADLVEHFKSLQGRSSQP